MHPFDVGKVVFYIEISFNPINIFFS